MMLAPTPDFIVDTIAGTVTCTAFKVCGCKRTFTLAQWRALPIVGEQRFEDMPPYRLEMRNCQCGTTLAIWTDRDGAPCDGDGNLTEVSNDK